MPRCSIRFAGGVFKLTAALVTTLVSACGGGGGSPAAPPPASGSVPLAILAFGDSLTTGIAATRPYPQTLSTQLSPVYTKGALSVTNAGQPGEMTSAGINRLRTLLQSSPKIVLIMEGVNDLNARVNNPDDPNDLSTAASALRGMVQQAKGVAGTVALATLPPQRPGWLLLTGRPAASPTLVDSLNAEIRRIAAEEGVQLVDVAAAFNGNLALISADGLHPTQAGYDLIAQTFFSVLRPVVGAL